MPWLTYSLGEVMNFHPAFEEAGIEALRLADLEQDYEWVHHLRTEGNSIVPDFVLRNKHNLKWILAFELKRTKEAVYSTRYQMQAKGYAESNQTQYLVNAPKYFAISNLELTILFALNGDRPPAECQVINGVFESGEFLPGSHFAHRHQFIEDLAELCLKVIQETTPQYDVVWPGILSEFHSYVSSASDNQISNIPEPTTINWSLVRDYFGSNISLDSTRLFFLRCLMAEYLRGLLIKSGHPNAHLIPPLQASPLNRVPISVANTIDNLRTIDFLSIFENFASEQYRNLNNNQIKELLQRYVGSITTAPRRVVDLTTSRVDSLKLIDLLLDTIYPISERDESGKVQTDSELGAILATLTITEPVNQVLDPGCGDGSLLSAAYDRLTFLGVNGLTALQSIKGIEADALSVRLAYLRLALKEPATLSPAHIISVVQGDMFSSSNEINNSDIILINPPFKRYEAQDRRPIPRELRLHYAEAIESIDGIPASTLGNQANLYNYYIEYLTKTVTEGTKLGIILDNKWYHNKYGEALRELLLENFEILGIVEYPHGIFFTGSTIATSILIIKKVNNINPEHNVRFVRCKVDPRGVDLASLSNAFNGNGPWPNDWTCRQVPQSGLNKKDGWKSNFLNVLINNFREGLSPLTQLFDNSRRGSLNKEEGGVGVYEFPFHRTSYGNQRHALPTGRRRRAFQTVKGRQLTATENQLLAHLARNIPQEFRGWALKNADDPNNFELNASDVSIQETIEPPNLRSMHTLYTQMSRSPWTHNHEIAVQQMRNNQNVADYIYGVERIVNLTEAVLPRQNLWIALREPYAGELIIPRKTRSGHRVHINPFALDNASERQVRISSNFISFKNCNSFDLTTQLDQLTAVKLIAAFLISSFGQLQFEMEGYNREGLLSIEDQHFERVYVLDPRLIRAERRQALLDAFSNLPYPIRTDRLSISQPERNALDELFAEEICYINPELEEVTLLGEIHSKLDEWITGRNP